MKSKKIAVIGLTLALAMILSFVESQIPALVGIKDNVVDKYSGGVSGAGNN